MNSFVFLEFSQLLHAQFGRAAASLCWPLWLRQLHAQAGCNAQTRRCHVEEPQGADGLNAPECEARERGTAEAGASVAGDLAACELLS